MNGGLNDVHLMERVCNIKENDFSVCLCIFRNNRITAEGAVYLAKGLMVNTCLQVLKVGIYFLLRS